MKYFVTGATGFLGAIVVRQLISKGHHVNAIIRDPGIRSVPVTKALEKK
jgi:uncharacterized protein YbjT (DUF2867 family)